MIIKDTFCKQFIKGNYGGSKDRQRILLEKTRRKFVITFIIEIISRNHKIRQIN